MLLLTISQYISEGSMNISGDLIYAVSGLNVDQLLIHFPSTLSKLYIYDFVPSNNYIFTLLSTLNHLIISGILVDGNLEVDFFALRNKELRSITIVNSNINYDWPSFEQITQIKSLEKFAIQVFDEDLPVLDFLSELPKLKHFTLFADFSLGLPIDRILGYVRGLKHLHLGNVRNSILPDLTEISMLQDLEVLELSLGSKYFPEIIYGIEDIESLQTVIINTDKMTKSILKFIEDLSDGLNWCEIQANPRIAFPDQI